jgi:hypothetical protein
VDFLAAALLAGAFLRATARLLRPAARLPRFGAAIRADRDARRVPFLFGFRAALRVRAIALRFAIFQPLIERV